MSEEAKLQAGLDQLGKDMADMLSNIEAVKGEAFSHGVAVIVNLYNLERVTPKTVALKANFAKFVKQQLGNSYLKELLSCAEGILKKQIEMERKLNGLAPDSSSSSGT
jgi:hypothetical protein